MPIGAIIGGAAALGGAVLSSRSSSSASRRAATAATQAATTNNATQMGIYNQNQQTLAPYTQRGNAAGDTINAALGLGGDQNAANAAFGQFRAGTGYDFGFNEGMRALNGSLAGRQLTESGAALKEAQRWGQGYSQQIGFAPWLQAVQQQQSVGLGSASALAGVGQNYANAASMNNNNAAGAIGNAALANNANTQQLIGGGLNLLGTVLGRRSSYG